MSDPINIQELLNSTSADYPDRPSLPEKRTFFGQLTGEIKADRSREKQTPFYHIGLRLTDAGKDVTQTDLAAITAAGFGLPDYECGVNFYLTPGAMPMLHRFCDSLGLDPNKSLREKLKLDSDGNPTQDTVEVLKGLPIMCRTPEKGTNGRVYAQNMDMVAGTAKAP